VPIVGNLFFGISSYKKKAADNERFGVMAAEARRNGSANLKVCTPQEVQWKPPLRQAALPHVRWLQVWDRAVQFGSEENEKIR